MKTITEKTQAHSTVRKLPLGLTGFTDISGKWVCTGSQMGRCDSIPADSQTVRKLHLVRLHFVDGDYDQGGAYWGSGDPVYWAYGDSDTEQAEIFIRAIDRDDAIRQVLETFPNARFYNRVKERKEWASFNRFQISLPSACVMDCSHSGDCDGDVSAWAPKIARTASITPEALAAELKEFGAGDENELADDAENWKRIIWIAATNIREEARQSVRR